MKQLDDGKEATIRGWFVDLTRRITRSEAGLYDFLKGDGLAIPLRAFVAVFVFFLNVTKERLFGAVGFLLLEVGDEQDIRISSFLAAIVMVVCSVTMFPTYGLIGATITSAAAVTSMNIINVFFVYSRHGTFVFPR